MEELSRQTIESTREALEKKAKLYDKLKKGKTGGLSEAQYGELLVDVSFVSLLSAMTELTNNSSMQKGTMTTIAATAKMLMSL